MVVLSGMEIVAGQLSTMARVYVGNLDSQVTAQELEDEFRANGVLRTDTPSPATAENSRPQDATWLTTLSKLDRLWGSQLPLTMAPMSGAAAASDTPSPATAENSRPQDAAWLTTLSEPDRLWGSQLPLPMVPTSGAAAASDTPSPATAENSRPQDTVWLTTLSEPELDFLISLKELAAMRARNTGHPRLAEKFDPRTLRSLGIVLLESFKEQLKEITVDPKMIESLALLRDLGTDCHEDKCNSSAIRLKEDCPIPSGIRKRRRQMWDGLLEEGSQSQKKRKMNEKREQSS